jgi:hypothetical protein
MEDGAQVMYVQALRKQTLLHRSFRWNGYWAFL